jgi:hypothetical protein
LAEQQTCGKGLAENSGLPAKLGDLIASMAEILELHTKALDVDDENGRGERDVYRRLVEEHRQTAARLHASAEEMASYRDLPMGRHDPEIMSSPELVDGFERFVRVETELSALLEERLEQDRALLRELGRAG